MSEKERAGLVHQVNDARQDARLSQPERAKVETLQGERAQLREQLGQAKTWKEKAPIEDRIKATDAAIKDVRENVSTASGDRVSYEQLREAAGPQLDTTREQLQAETGRTPSHQETWQRFEKDHPAAAQTAAGPEKQQERMQTQTQQRDRGPEIGR